MIIKLEDSKMIKHYIFKKEINGQVCHCVKAVMVGCAEDAIKIIKRAARKNVNEDFLKLAEMPKTIQRTVVCDPSDDFNAAYGLRLADKRLIDAYNTLRYKAVNRYIKACEDQYEAVKDLVLVDVFIRDERLKDAWYEETAAMLLKSEQTE